MNPILTKEDKEQFQNILKHMYSNIQHPSKLIQIGGSVALTKVIQNAPVEILNLEIERICLKIHECLSSNTCKSHSSLLECLISLILSVESEFEQYAPNFLPLLLQNMANQDWNTRKMSIDVVYTLAAIIQEVLEPFKYEVLEVLNHCRFDKIKPVREAAIEAINVIKEIASPQDQEVAKKQFEEKRQKELARKMKTVRPTTPSTTYYSAEKAGAPDRIEVQNQKVQKAKPAKTFLKKSQKTELIKPSEREPKKAKPTKSIFKGPANPAFFKQQKDDGIFVKEPMLSGRSPEVNLPGTTSPSLVEVPKFSENKHQQETKITVTQEQIQEKVDEIQLNRQPKSHAFSFTKVPASETPSERDRNLEIESKLTPTPLSDGGHDRPYQFSAEVESHQNGVAEFSGSISTPNLKTRQIEKEEPKTEETLVVPHYTVGHDSSNEQEQEVTPVAPLSLTDTDKVRSVSKCFIPIAVGYYSRESTNIPGFYKK